MAGKRIKGIKKHGLDIVKSTVKRAAQKVLKDKDVKKEVDRKLSVCDTCDKKAPDQVFGGFLCSDCLCQLENLVHSKKGCPLNKW